jgi:hypothetical protein
MKLLSKESLYQITDLSKAKITAMKDDELEKYRETLADAANLFPVQKDRLQDAFAKAEYAPVLQWLKSMRNSLSRIHAYDLVKQCENQLAQNTDIDAIRHDRLATFIDFFLGSVTMLYTDIQILLEKAEIEEFGKPADNYAKRAREQLTLISEINEEKVRKIEDANLGKYMIKLENFNDEIEEKIDALRGSLRMKNYKLVINWLNDIKNALASIHADALADECLRQIKQNSIIANIRHEKLELTINFILSSLKILYDDIASLKV